MSTADSTPSACRNGFVPLFRRLTALLALCGGLLTFPTGASAAAVNDPLYPQQWGITQIGAEQVWSITRGAGITVAVIDSGSGPHPDLDMNLVTGVNLFGGLNEQGAPDVDTQGHGTHVAGIIAATANNSIGVVGVAPDARVLPIRVLGADGRGRSTDVVTGVRMAADMGARVINLSLGGDQESPALNDAITYATNMGSLVVAAAGNDGPTAPPKWPAAFDLTIAVSFVDQQNVPSARSQSGAYIDIAAPGVSILSTAMGNYGFSTGSSMAAAYVSGAAALLFAAQPSLTVSQVRDILLQSATDIGAPGRDDLTGSGLLNVSNAFMLLAAMFPDSAQPAVMSLGRVNETLNAVVNPNASVQWFRCTRFGTAVARKPANCAVIPNAVSSRYRTSARDVGMFIRVAARAPGEKMTRFSAATPRIMAKWLRTNQVDVASSTPISALLGGPSRGSITARVRAGTCTVTRTALVAPANPDTCTIVVRVAARSPFPAMNLAFQVIVNEPAVNQ